MNLSQLLRSSSDRFGSPTWNGQIGTACLIHFCLVWVLEYTPDFVLFLKENSYLMFSTLLTFFGLSSNASPCTLKSPLFGVFLEWNLTFLLKSPLFEVFELNLIQKPKILNRTLGLHSLGYSKLVLLYL